MIKLKIIVFLMAATLCSSCINQLGITGPSISKGKKKRKIGVPHQFSTTLFTYRDKNGYWPKSGYDFVSAGSEGIKDLYKQGFASWHFRHISNDTLQVYLVHEPIDDGAHVGIVPIPDKKIYLMTQYVYPDRLIQKKIIKKRLLTGFSQICKSSYSSSISATLPTWPSSSRTLMPLE